MASMARINFPESNPVLNSTTFFYKIDEWLWVTHPIIRWPA